MTKLILLLCTFSMFFSCVGTTSRSGGSSSRTSAALQFPVNIASPLCACKDQKPLNDETSCTSFCATKNPSFETLYGSVELSTSVKTEVGNLYNYCQTERESIGNINPSCNLEVRKSDGSISNIEVTLFNNSNAFQANISNLSYNEIYSLNLVENSSGEISNNIQILKDSNIGNPASQMKKVLVHQYECRMNYTYTNPYSILEEYFKLSFFFSQANPNPVPPSVQDTHCHENYIWDPIDSASKTRLNLDRNVFSLWDSSDNFLSTSTETGNLNIHDELKRRLSLQSDIEIFSPLYWDKEPNFSNDTDSELPLLGYAMRHWYISSEGGHVCLNSTHFTGSQQIFKELGNFISETEGLYIGEAINLPYHFDSTTGIYLEGLKDRVFINETNLYKIIYRQSGSQKIRVDKEAMKTLGSAETIYFVWPQPVGFDNPSSGHDVTSVTGDQIVYRLKNRNSNDLIYADHSTFDGKFACIPK